VVAVDAPWASLAQPLELEGVLLAGAWDARTGRGNGYRGVVTAVAEGWQSSGSERAVRLGFDGIQITRAAEGVGEDVQIAGQFTSDRPFPSPR